MLSRTDMMIVFQFHKGTIKTDAMRDMVKRYNYFNSIKVQLKLLKCLQII